MDLRNASSPQNAESYSIAALWGCGRVEALPDATDESHVWSLLLVVLFEDAENM